MSMRHRSTVLAALLVVLTGAGAVVGAAASGPGGKDAGDQASSPQAAHRVASRWVSAIADQDPVAACALMAEPTVAEFVQRGTTCVTQIGVFAADEQVKAEFAGYVSGMPSASAVTVAGATAYVPLDVQHAVALTLTGNGWRVTDVS